MNKKIVKMKIVDWWNDDTEENFYSNQFVNILQSQYEIIYSNNPDFIIYGPFGKEHLKYDCVKIFYTGENITPDYNIADYAIGFDYMDFCDRYLRIPLWIFCGIFKKIKYNKTKFCSFLVSNGKATMLRDIFFEELSKYKKVDSGGRWKNNIGAPIENKIEWLKSYKFNICFENSSHPGYLTEKLFDAFAAGCIPIYWGDTSLRVGEENTALNNNHNIDYSKIHGGGGVDNNLLISIDTRIPNIPQHLIDYKINPKSFINAHNFSTIGDLIEEVKRIDNDKQAYEEMINEPIFLDNFNPITFYENKLFIFLDSIVSQGRELAKRRGWGQYKEDYLKRAYMLDKERKYIDYCFKHKSIISNIRNISELPRNIIRRIRGK